MGAGAYAEPGWDLDLLTILVCPVLLALSPLFWVIIIISYIYTAIISCTKKNTYIHREPPSILKDCCKVLIATVAWPLASTWDAMGRVPYRASRLTHEIRKTWISEPETLYSHQNTTHTLTTETAPPQRNSDGHPLYTYRQLRRDHDIRLFEIYPSGHSTEHSNFDKIKMRGRVIQSNLLWGPRYEAVSYTWATEDGDSEATEEVYIMNEKARIYVTKNCMQVLKRLRLGKKRRLIWIDTICIDQHSDTERTHQVSLMARIYMSAHKVIAYTGEGNGETDKLFDWMNSIGPQEIAALTSQTYHWKAFFDPSFQVSGSKRLGFLLEALWAQLSPKGYQCFFYMFPQRKGQKGSDGLVSQQELAQAASEYFSRRWFQRVWVLQEVSLPDVRRTVIVCGEKTTSALRALHALSALPDGHGAMSMVRIFLVVRNKIMNPTRSHLLDIMIETGTRQCGDPRDKLFGILSISYGMDEGRFPELAADYELDVAHVYTKYSKFFIKQYGLAFFWSLIKSQPAIPGLPSWCADWSVPWPNYKAVRGIQLPAISRVVDDVRLDITFGCQEDGKETLRLVGCKITSGYFTRDGHLDGSQTTSVESVEDLEVGYSLIGLSSCISALLRQVGDHYVFIQVCPYSPSEGDLFRLVENWAEQVVNEHSISDQEYPKLVGDMETLIIQ